MSRWLLVCALFCVLALPATAGAQEGNGPYAPFPSVSDATPGDAWYALMDADVTSARLQQGAFAGALRPVATERGASVRAGVGVSGTGLGALLAALGLGLLAAAALLAITVLRSPSDPVSTS